VLLWIVKLVKGCLIEVLPITYYSKLYIFGYYGF